MQAKVCVPMSSLEKRTQLLFCMRKGERCRSLDEDLGGSAWGWARFRGLSRKSEWGTAKKANKERNV